MSLRNVIAAPFLLLASQIVTPPLAAQDEAETFASNFAVPVFESIDENGVDLTTGTWRVRSPILSIGEGVEGQQRGLEWTGSAWRHIGSPSLWRDGSKHIVQFDGGSYEFNGRGSNYSKRLPIDGSSLECQFELPSDIINFCIFISRDGDIVRFTGRYSSLTWYPDDHGFSGLRFGNVGISQVNVSRAALGNPAIYELYPGDGFVGGIQYGHAIPGQMTDYFYDESTYSTNLASFTLVINTPNNNDNDEHYLRPKSVTQEIADEFGQKWRYTFNGDRELTRVSRPGGLADITATYYSNGKVKTITTPAGTWNYSYSTPGSDRATTVTNPEGATKYLVYDDDHYFVKEVRDARNRTTHFDWNTDRRLWRIRYPGGTRTEFNYDARGNVTHRTEFPRTGTGSQVWAAGGYPSCSTNNRANCNKPRWVRDPRGNQTDFEYLGNQHAPARIVRPAPQAGAPRPTIINEYQAGRISKRSICPTQATCVGSADEVVVEYRYKTISFSSCSSSECGPNSGYPADILRSWFFVVSEETVRSGGETRVTCHRYDRKGRRISSVPPAAGLSVCDGAENVDAVAVTASPPQNGPAKVLPTFPGTSGGGGSPGGGGTDPDPDPCANLPPNTHCP